MQSTPRTWDISSIESEALIWKSGFEVVLGLRWMNSCENFTDNKGEGDELEEAFRELE